MTCLCRDTGWICEAHPDQPWGGESSPSHCGAPGVPCQRCNPCGGRDDPPDVSLVIVERVCGTQKTRRRANGPG